MSKAVQERPFIKAATVSIYNRPAECCKAHEKKNAWEMVKVDDDLQVDP